MSGKAEITKLITSTALVTLAGSGMALAQSADWTGFYAGGNFSVNAGDYSEIINDFVIDSSNIGGFIGYNTAFGSVVVGLEYGAQFGQISDDTYRSIDNLQDLRIRVGTTFGKALVYGAVGVSSASTSSSIFPDYFVSGVNYGIGIDYAVNGNLFVGLDYTVRDMQEADGVVDVEALSSASIRVGYKF